MTERHGRQSATRAMVTLLQMGRQFSYAKLEEVLAQALDLGCTDVAAVRHLFMADQLRHAVAEVVEIGALAAYERPLPTMMQYDQLLSAVNIEVRA